MSRTLLIDADIIAYVGSASTQRSYDWDGDGQPAVVADFEAAKKQARETIDGFMETLKGDRLVICLSDDFKNFRKAVLPTYKGNRTGDRPVHLYDLKDHLQASYPFDLRPTLEADDVMGILATEPAPGEDRIIVSADKDMKTIPGLLYQPHLPRPKVRAVSLAEADAFHLHQTVTGDATDHYAGCPGAGPVAADLAVQGAGVERYVHTFKSGPRKGLEETRWRAAQHESPWRAVVSLYHKAGLTERDALVQARCARILRHGEWNGRPILWNPPGNFSSS